jgi:N-acetylmuramoyl-L-alanine amidase
MPTDPVIRDWPLPYETELDHRESAAIDLVVIHCTELPDMAMTREFGERVHYPEKGTGNCGHYYITEAGEVCRFVADDRIAHHVKDWNTRSIGIEMFNLGRYPNWRDSRHQTFATAYTKEQINSLLALLAKLRRDIPTLRYIAGHEDLDTRLEPASDDPTILLRRRRDPGPLFPWDAIVPASGLTRLKP